MLKHKPLDVRQSANSIPRQLMDAVFCFFLSFLFDVAVFLELLADVFLHQKGRFRRKSNNKTLHMITWFFSFGCSHFLMNAVFSNPFALICHKNITKMVFQWLNMHEFATPERNAFVFEFYWIICIYIRMNPFIRGLWKPLVMLLRLKSRRKPNLTFITVLYIFWIYWPLKKKLEYLKFINVKQ